MTRLTIAEFEENFKQAVDARRRWLEAIEHNTGHYDISIRWAVFTELVPFTKMRMGEFEQYLKKVDPDEYNYAFTVGRR